KPRTIRGTNVQIISVGHKGKYVGVLGLFRKNNRYELKYELVKMGEEYNSPDNVNNPIYKLMEDYARTVRDHKYMKKFPRGPHPLQVQLKAKGIHTEYAGSDSCTRCHAAELLVWMRGNPGPDGKLPDRRHSIAYDGLVNATKP